MTLPSDDPLTPRAVAKRDPSRPLLQLRAQKIPRLAALPHAGQNRRSTPTYRRMSFVEWLIINTDHTPNDLNECKSVSVSDSLSRAFGYGVNNQVGQQLLRDGLANFRTTLEELLKTSIAVEHSKSLRMVTVLGCIRYEIDATARRVSLSRVYPDGTAKRYACNDDLTRPLWHGEWLYWLLEDFGLTEKMQAQANLFLTMCDFEERDSWLVRNVLALLRREPKFIKLCKQDLPDKLNLAPALVALAAHCHSEKGRTVSSSAFNLVWQHQAVFWQIARENPHLLKLLYAFLKANMLPLKSDALAEMRSFFKKDDGLGDAAWKYVVRHGTRLFEIPCEMSTNGKPFDVCIYYLRALNAAGLPPPPAPALAKVWLRCFVHGGTDRLFFLWNWCKVDPTVLRAILLEGHLRREQPDFAQFVSEAAGVLRWAIDSELKLAKQQSRSGWKWLRRHWLSWLAMHKLVANSRGTQWSSLLERTVIGRFEVIPLISSAELAEEAIAMRHCIDTYRFRCESNEWRVFSVRCALTGRRVATLAIFDCEDAGWVAFDIKAFANNPTSTELGRLAEKVATLYDELAAIGGV